jgi:ferrous iron transport protein B
MRTSEHDNHRPAGVESTAPNGKERAPFGEVASIQVALAGQPNVGKSTVFNLLTGLNQHVGNWPGKTVEQKTGSFRLDGLTFELVDLPGTYSLTANSPEELIARDYIITHRPDVVVVILDAATMERNLYLVAEILPLPSKVVVGLNMIDVARQEGIQIEPDVLQAALGVPVVPMTATKNQGVRELVEVVSKLARGDLPYEPRMPEIREDHQHVLDEIIAIIHAYVPAHYPVEWTALKLLEGDRELFRIMQEAMPAEAWEQVYGVLLQHDDALMAVASGRYQWIGRMIRAAVVRPQLGQITLTGRIDRWATHPGWGLLILAGILGFIFWLTFTFGAPLQGWLDTVIVQGLSGLLGQALAGAPAWLSGLLIDGILAGAGMVITFLPILVVFFAALAVLEDTGYMARAAFVMDRFMHLMGLHGKSFMPLLLGFGCNVPAVVGSRIIDTPRSRLMTIMLAPLVPCAARMAVVAFFTPIFFGRAATLVAWGLIALSLIVLALLGIFMSRFVLKGERAAFIMELPLYHKPNLRTIGIQVWQHSVEFLKKAGTLILVMSVFMWVLSTQPNGDIGTSYLARFGQWIAPAGLLLGMDWKMVVALLASFVAKENSIASLSILYGAGQSEAGLAQILGGAITPAAALAFLVVQMLFVPCAATVGAIKQETHSWGWTAVNVLGLLIISLGMGVAVYQFAHLVIG